MPKIRVVFYTDDDGSSPVLEWLEELRRRDRRAYAKCYARIAALQSAGHELRRPLSDYLRDGIHELRIRLGTVNYRMLYFFSGDAAVLAHGLVKEKRVPDRDIAIAVARKLRFETDLERYTYDGD